MGNELKVVLGLGKTGLSCVRYLRTQGYDIAVADSRPNPPFLEEFNRLYPDIPLKLGEFDDAMLRRASEIIVSPGISVKDPIIAKYFKKGVPVVGDIELFARAVSKPVVAITGSNGKSTVTSLVGHLATQAGLSVKVGGNLGVAALDLLKDDQTKTDFYILELSSFQLETTFSLQCMSAVNLNISPDHMDRYETIEDYIAAKLRIYQNCVYPIINLDDPRSYGSTHLHANVLGFTVKEPFNGHYGIRQQGNQIYLTIGQKNIINVNELKIRGYHQYANALAGLALGSKIGLSHDSMVPALSSFIGLSHRCQWVRNIGGVDWYNDSKATNVGSALAALEGLGPTTEGKLILLAGGLGKNADFSELYEPVSQYVKTLVLYGKDRGEIAASLQGATNILMVDDLKNAVHLAHANAAPADVVLLSPACASFDMFKDFEERGNLFMTYVRELISIDPSR